MIKVGNELLLRKLDKEHARVIHDCRNDLDLQILIASSPLPTNYEDTVHWLEKVNSDPHQIFFGIFWCGNTDPKLIGVVRLMFINWIHRNAELGIYIVQEEYRGRGIGQKVLNSVIDYAFFALNLNKLYLKVTVNNLRAYNCYESVGFAKVGVLKEHFWLMGKYTDAIMMEMILPKTETQHKPMEVNQLER